MMASGMLVKVASGMLVNDGEWNVGRMNVASGNVGE